MKKNKKIAIKNLEILTNEDNPFIFYTINNQHNYLIVLHIEQMMTLPQYKVLEIFKPHCKLNDSIMYKCFIDNVLKIQYPNTVNMLNIMNQMINNEHFKKLQQQWLQDSNTHDLHLMLYYLFAYLQESVNQETNT